MSENNLSKDEMDFVIELLQNQPIAMDPIKTPSSWADKFLEVYLIKAATMNGFIAEPLVKDKDKKI